ncbi:MAG: DUF1080 domain-containing protein [Bryobacteraceae bacterium]|nr:DUF1080 domain-containing protein [Bryobacteraceae bacterium]
MSSSLLRRDLLLGGSLAPAAFAQPTSLFDGQTLRGWHAKPRLPIPRFPGAKEPDRQSPGYIRAAGNTGRWAVESGAIVGGQEPAGSGIGAYLVSDEAFDDFELELEVRPDWPIDTGILVRTAPEGTPGFQVLVDHRPSGCIGGYFGNGLAQIHAYPYALNGETDSHGKLTRLLPAETSERTNRIPLDFAAPVSTFLRAWKVNDWNRFRIRSVGALPTLTTWINGERISQLDVAKVKAENFDADAVLTRLGRAGHIALEVHNNDAEMGDNRWKPGAVCRWRNIRIQRLKHKV